MRRTTIHLPDNIVPYTVEDIKKVINEYGEVIDYHILGGYYSTWVDAGGEINLANFESLSKFGSTYLLDLTDTQASFVIKGPQETSYIVTGHDGVRVMSSDIQEMWRLVEAIRRCISIKSGPNRIGIIISRGGNLDYVEKETKEVKYNPDYYIDDISTLRQELLKNLIAPASSLYLFHGKPGTGKTFFLRSLISDIKTLNPKKKVFYIPPFIVESMSSPEFITFALNNMQESILIVEDAEEALKGQGNRNMAVNNLLNVSDGILGDALKCHILCTFNQDVKNLDSAIVRKGRLKYIQEFTELPSEKVEKICGIKESMTLGDALNREDTGIKQQLKIGFQ